MGYTETDRNSYHYVRKPDWLKIKLPGGQNYSAINRTLNANHLHTVCVEARCPNQGECWGQGTATIMILGDICTRNCRFCAVKTGRPEKVDTAEPERVAQALENVGISYVVLTSVTRDDLPDGGARIFAEVITEIRARNGHGYIEVLIPDFKGDAAALDTVLQAQPHVLGHNLETIARLYSTVRPQANYRQSLQVLDRAKKAGFVTKSGIMIGLGESFDEVIALMQDLREVGCDIMTLGQYLQPSRKHLPVQRYVEPAEFAEYKQIGTELGFRLIESGPLVRSSYHAERAIPIIKETCAGGDGEGRHEYPII